MNEESIRPHGQMLSKKTKTEQGLKMRIHLSETPISVSFPSPAQSDGVPLVQWEVA